MTTAEKKPVALSRLQALPVRRVRGRFDSAVTTDDNRRHWANADSLSADAAANSEVRRILRNRARYEVANNSYARGIVLTLANDCVGTGPRLQILTGNDSLNREIEREFDRWARQVSLPQKLRTMRMAKATDGEAFAILVNNPGLDHCVSLDLRLIEADLVTSPSQLLLDEREVDGIRLNAFGNPVAYHVLKSHPGSNTWRPRQDYVTVPAEHVIHAFRQERPGQHRGIPEITPALPLQSSQQPVGTLEAWIHDRTGSCADYARQDGDRRHGTVSWPDLVD
ncbi:MAG: phage portal protein [Planctomycetes bacterium]|nr:phage portal protein [Planctomycetota bacterium]